MFVYPYKTGSNSSKALAKALGAKRIKLENSKFKGSPDKIVVNWGNSNRNAEVEKCTVLNNPEQVSLASNKLRFFQTVSGEVSIPDFTENREDARAWVLDGGIVVCREKLTGNSGEGIVLLNSEEEFNEYDHTRCRLYVKYIPKEFEYRVHVVGQNPFMVQRKAIDKNYQGDPNFKVRNRDNGFIFVKNEDKAPPEGVLEEAIKAVHTCGLHFGAVDVIYNKYRKKAYVLEINTAPGLDGTSPDAYMKSLTAFVNMMGETGEERINNGIRLRKPKYKILEGDRPVEQAPPIDWDAIFDAPVRPVGDAFRVGD